MTGKWNLWMYRDTTWETDEGLRGLSFDLEKRRMWKYLKRLIIIDNSGDSEFGIEQELSTIHVSNATD